MRATPEIVEIADGRTRRRFAAMRRIQQAALDLFEARGFAAVTIEDIAGAAEVGPATVYRNFGTKERIVLWDDYDPALFEAIARRLPGEPRAVVLDALIAALGPIYARDRERILRRSRLALAIPEVVAVSAADMRELRSALAAVFVRHKAARAGIEADVVAAAIVGALDVAIAHWVRGNGRTPLVTLLRRAFAQLAS